MYTIIIGTFLIGVVGEMRVFSPYFPPLSFYSIYFPSVYSDFVLFHRRPFSVGLLVPFHNYYCVGEEFTLVRLAEEVTKNKSKNQTVTDIAMCTIGTLRK